ncbi:DinB family protein [Chachezhania antarctica]|uniref:DinB family protein n=1 Tax=Chachezhania antarctica TaxID=2340860 RepID=UPI000EAF99AA|nr:DinB family protein [Chachezhania antarctica]|tara:strand:+ start:123 stop:647 length:525 start_codon:yes stop_codon:yes gene_type:complete
MSAAAPFVTMARNNAWANEVLHGAVAGMDEARFTAPRPGFFPSLAATLNHILLVDRFYLAALEGQGVPYADIDAPDITEPGALYAAQRACDTRLIAFCEGLSEGALSETRDTRRVDGPVPERVDALLLHLFQHQVHHRGQAHVQVQDAGLSPPQLDDFHLEYGRVASARAWLDG